MNTQTNFQTSKDYFIIFALIFASLSLASSCLVFPSLIFGCLGMIFALLSKRNNNRLVNEAKLAILFAALGLLMSIILILLSLPSAWQIITTGEYPEWIIHSVSGNQL